MRYSTVVKAFEERARKMVALRRENPTHWTLRRIGDRYGITPQRVGQILTRRSETERTE